MHIKKAVIFDLDGTLANTLTSLAYCTNRALEEAAAALQAEGVETELVWIGNKEIRGCIACGICGKTGELIRQYVPEANL